MALAQMIGQEVEQGLAMVTDDRLLLKTQLCKKIAELLETLAPGKPDFVFYFVILRSL